MRNLLVVTLTSLLVGCAGIPTPPSAKCSTVYECEIEGYAKAR